MPLEKVEKKTDKLVIYTDGSCSGNPGPGGWGVYIVDGALGIFLKGADSITTNNKMELLAAINALKASPLDRHLVIYTDSVYVQKGVTTWIQVWRRSNWRTASGSPVKNLELWKELLDLVKDRSIEWSWVRGHGNNIGNQIADMLANLGKDSLQSLV